MTVAELREKIRALALQVVGERSKADDEWLAYGHWAETRGNKLDKALYRTANMVRALNDSSLLTYSTKIMASTDDAFSLIVGRARAREKAFLEAAEKLPDSNFANLDAKFFKDMEDKFKQKIFNSDGTLNDEMAEFRKKEHPTCGNCIATETYAQESNIDSLALNKKEKLFK